MRRSERVFHDLTESTEYVEMLETRFYFSSSFNKDRFLNGYQSYIKEEEDKIIAKYNVIISVRYYLLISYYLKIEKRGFYITKLMKNVWIPLERNRITFTEIEV